MNHKLTNRSDGDKRSSQRHRVLQQAFVIFNDRQSTLTCRVRNLSDTGCCLRVSNPALLPDQFIIQFPVNLRERACEVVWRSADKVGVRFID